MDQKTQAALQAAGQHGALPTVKVKADNEEGFMVINEADFDKDKHEKLVENAPAKTSKKSKE